MPEYLAPGVYVEEVDTGSKPIEGVSTSTAGVVGVTERGPVDFPILVTSFGEFARWFGERLRLEDYSNGPKDPHCYLPHAVEGFFTNGGKRLFVTRVLDVGGATRASADAYDRGAATSASTILLRAASELTGTLASGPILVALDSTNLADNDVIRIGDGSGAEYRSVASNPAADRTLVALSLPLSRSHDVGAAVEEFARTPAGAAVALVEGIETGAPQITVRGLNADINALLDGVLIEIGTAATAEHRFVDAATGRVAVSGSEEQVVLKLDSPLFIARPAGTAVQRLADPAADADAGVASLATAGSALLFVEDNTDLADATQLIVVDRTDNDVREVRRHAALRRVVTDSGAYGEIPAGSLVEVVAASAAATALDGATAVADNSITVDSVDGLVIGQRLLVGPPGPTQQAVTITAIDKVALTVGVSPALTAVHADNDPVSVAPKTTTAAVSSGATVIPLDDRMGLKSGAILEVGGAEVVTISLTPKRAPGGATPDAGTVIVAPALRGSYPDGTSVVPLSAATLVAGRPSAVTVIPSAVGDPAVLVSDAAAVAAGDLLRITDPGGNVSFLRASANAAAVAPRGVDLDRQLARSHPIASVIAERAALFEVQALDAGSWGNRLRVSYVDEPTGLVSKTTFETILNDTTVKLGSPAGVEPGTVLELFDPATEFAIGDPLKVEAVNRAAGYSLTLAAPGLTTDHKNADAAIRLTGGRLGVRSREFSVVVTLLRQPDPITPSRNDQALAVETFRYLSMDPRHSAYFERVIGAIDPTETTPLRKSDGRTEGASWYIRVRDLGADDEAKQAIRLGPETLVDTLPDGRMVPARHPLDGGDDSIPTLQDKHYVGEDNVTPEKRTGLQTMRNLEDVSLVSVPGRTGAEIQNALIAHCELMRYRFAVLDSPVPPADEIPDVQALRGRYDTKYAALYYPWLTIPEPFPKSLGRLSEYAIPPAGHVLGIYARTDIERGVHKAPANEVVRGVVGLRRTINKEQQDILNPYPVNINVIRDFRPNNRGIRVYGGRCITSDSDWKYVNVRRLLIFIEASLDRGLQWVVFEPNAEPLWARVVRSVSNFLTVVWRNGALEGTKVEEAFFVRCDRTTMTQTDIDSGRLIVQIGVAPVKPAEFVIVRIGLWTARSDS